MTHELALLLDDTSPTTVAFAEDLLLSAKALDAAAEAKEEIAKETQSLHEVSLELEDQLAELSIKDDPHAFVLQHLALHPWNSSPLTILVPPGTLLAARPSLRSR